MGKGKNGMAKPRLSEIMKRTKPEYAASSPLLLEACALYYDRVACGCVAQMKWKNIDSRIAKAALVSVCVKDAFGDEIPPVQFQYRALEAERGREFGVRVPVVLDTDRIVDYKVRPEAVSFSDGSVWKAPQDAPVMKPLPDSRKAELPDDLREQFDMEVKNAGRLRCYRYEVQEAMGLWQCGCGSWQPAGTPCIKCGITRGELDKLSDREFLQEKMKSRREEERRKKQEKEKQRQLEIEREKKEAVTDEAYRAAGYLLEYLHPAYSETVSNFVSAVGGARVGKRIRLESAYDNFRNILSRMKEPAASLSAILPETEQDGENFTAEVHLAYQLLEASIRRYLETEKERKGTIYSHAGIRRADVCYLEQLEKIRRATEEPE